MAEPTFVSSDPLSAFYKSPQARAYEAAGLDQFGQNPANIGNTQTGWWNAEGDWIAPSAQATAPEWLKEAAVNLTRFYNNPVAEKGWYQAKTRDLAKGSHYSGSPQTWEEAAAIVDYYNNTGFLPASEWVRDYLDSRYPDRGQTASKLSYFPGSTPYEMGMQRPANALARNQYGVLAGPWLAENTAALKDVLPETKRKEIRYGSDPVGATAMLAADPAREYAAYVNSLTTGNGAREWLQEQYLPFYREWEYTDKRGSFIDYIRTRLQAALKQYEKRFESNPKYAPAVKEWYLPNIRK